MKMGTLGRRIFRTADNRHVTLDDNCCCRTCAGPCSGCIIRYEYECSHQIFERELAKVENSEDRRNMVCEYIWLREHPFIGYATTEGYVEFRN